MSLSVGQTAPEFTLKDQSQKEVKLSDFAGKKRVVLVFYPLDWSPTCTNEHACFVNDMKNFDTLDAEVLGVSVDSVWSHKAYAEKMGIKYSLLADFQPRAPRPFRVVHPAVGLAGHRRCTTPTMSSCPRVRWCPSPSVPPRPAASPCDRRWWFSVWPRASSSCS